GAREDAVAAAAREPDDRRPLREDGHVCVPLQRAGTRGARDEGCARRRQDGEHQDRDDHDDPDQDGRPDAHSVADGFGSVTDVTAPPGDADRLLVAQQDGLIVLLKDGVRQATPFLDLRDRVNADGEKGFLSLAFAPDYATSGLLYVDYNDLLGHIRLVEYHRSADNPDA